MFLTKFISVANNSPQTLPKLTLHSGYSEKSGASAGWAKRWPANHQMQILSSHDFSDVV